MLNVKVCDSAIGKRLNKSGLLGRIAKRIPFFSKKYMSPHLMFAKLHLNKPQFWNNVLWTDETKVEVFGRNAQQHV